MFLFIIVCNSTVISLILYLDINIFQLALSRVDFVVYFKHIVHFKCFTNECFVRPAEQFCAVTPLKICINLCVPSCFSLATPGQLAARCYDYKWGPWQWPVCIWYVSVTYSSVLWWELCYCHHPHYGFNAYLSVPSSFDSSCYRSFKIALSSYSYSYLALKKWIAAT